MGSKLILHTEEKLLKEIKRYAREKGTSVSAIVNDFFKALLVEKEALEKEEIKPSRRITDKLYGIWEGKKFSREDYKRFLEDKYL